MVEKRKLGRGLSTLIPTERTEKPAEPTTAAPATPRATPTEELPASALRDVTIDSIVPNPHQPRVHFDEEKLAKLFDDQKAPKQMELLLSYLHLSKTEGEVTQAQLLKKSNASTAQLKGLVDKKILIQANGNVQYGVCENGGHIGNIFDPIELFTQEYSICHQDECHTIDEVMITKFKV